MRFRVAVIFVALLAVGSVARAECLACVPLGVGPDGTCQPTTSGWCQYTCCLWGLGAYCETNENIYRCVDPDGFVIPSAYFTTSLPLETQGSKLRLMIGKGRPVQQRCAASALLQKSS
ncbi:MAG TPA: hypothetical protein VJ276_13870 [Thermoanaerobaculia bacterium]|nr:hypothetical protein [Thermoanaerobaculia bacterium]